MKNGKLSELDRALLDWWRELSHVYCRVEVRKLKGNIRDTAFHYREMEENVECFKIAKARKKNDNSI